MRCAVIVAVVSLAALMASGAELVSNCDREALRKSRPVRVSADVAKKRLVKKSEIPLASAVFNKLQDAQVSLDLSISESGLVKCFILYVEGKSVELGDGDKEDLRGAIAAAVDDWQFEQYVLNERAVRFMARLPLRVERRRLVVAGRELRGLRE